RTSPPGAPCSCLGAPRSTGASPAGPATTATPAAVPGSPRPTSSPVGCWLHGRQITIPTPVIPTSPTPLPETKDRRNERLTHPIPTLRPARRVTEGPGRGGRLEHPRPRTCRPRVHPRQHLAEPRRPHRRPRPHRRVPHPHVGTRAGLRPSQG